MLGRRRSSKNLLDYVTALLHYLMYTKWPQQVFLVGRVKCELSDDNDDGGGGGDDDDEAIDPV